MLVVVRPALEGHTGDESKFKVPKSLRVIHLMSKIRKSMHVGPDIALYLYHERRLLAHHRMIGDVFDCRVSPEPFLQLELRSVPAFGAALKC